MARSQTITSGSVQYLNISTYLYEHCIHFHIFLPFHVEYKNSCKKYFGIVTCINSDLGSNSVLNNPRSGERLLISEHQVAADQGKTSTIFHFEADISLCLWQLSKCDRETEPRKKF